MSSGIPGYDAWKLASPPESEPIGVCDACGNDVYDDFYEIQTSDTRWENYCAYCTRDWMRREIDETPSDRLHTVLESFVEPVMLCQFCAYHPCRCPED